MAFSSSLPSTTSSKEGSLSDSEAAAAATLHPSGAEAACDLAWRICFYLVCFPLCYPCYVSRTVRKRTKSKHRLVMSELRGWLTALVIARVAWFAKQQRAKQ